MEDRLSLILTVGWAAKLASGPEGIDEAAPEQNWARRISGGDVGQKRYLVLGVIVSTPGC
jgi:hypothetical protein